MGRHITLDLRPYEIRDVEQLGAAFNQGARAVCYVSPTGSGKTVVFSHIIGRVVSKGRRVGILVHRRELVHQAAAKLSWAGVPHGIIGAGLDRDHDAPVLIMSVQSAARRLDRLPNLDFAVADEGHHSVSTSWAQVLPRGRRLRSSAQLRRRSGWTGKGSAAVSEGSSIPW